MCLFLKYDFEEALIRAVKGQDEYAPRVLKSSSKQSEHVPPKSAISTVGGISSMCRPPTTIDWSEETLSLCSLRTDGLHTSSQLIVLAGSASSYSAVYIYVYLLCQTQWPNRLIRTMKCANDDWYSSVLKQGTRMGGWIKLINYLLLEFGMCIHSLV